MKIEQKPTLYTLRKVGVLDPLQIFYTYQEAFDFIAKKVGTETELQQYYIVPLSQP